MLISNDEANKRRTRLLCVMLIATTIACGGMLAYMVRVRADIRAEIAELQTMTDDKEITALKWHILQIEKENDFLRKRNAELEGLISSGA